MRLPWLYLLIFFGGGGGDGRVPSNPCLADLLGTQHEGATVFYKCRDRESPLTHSQTPNRRYNMVRRISTDIYTNVVMISAGVKCYSVIRVV